LAEILGNNIGLNEKTAMLIPQSQISDMVLGSKLAFMNWIWYMCYIWCLKGVLLCLYWKLTYVCTENSNYHNADLVVCVLELEHGIGISLLEHQSFVLSLGLYVS